MGGIDAGNVVPLGDRLLVRRHLEEQSKGGIFLVQNLDRRGTPGTRFNSTPDYWEGEVLAVGSGADRSLKCGDRVLVYTWSSDGKGAHKRGLFTGTSDGCTSETFFIRSEDVICAVER
jgi:co-chaperonin GroES (HSP10)